MPRALIATLLFAALVQVLSSDGWAQVGAPNAESGAPVHMSDPEEACRQTPTRACVADMAIAAIEQDKYASVREWLMIDLAIAQARGGDPGAALAALKHMKGDILSYPQIPGEVTDALIAAGDIAPILAAADKVDDEFQRAFAFERVAEKAAATGSPKMARAAFLRALAATASIPSLESRAFAITSAARGALSVGDLETANEALALAWKLTKTVMTPAVRARTLASIVTTRAAMGDIARAMSTAQTIEELPERAAALAAVGEAQAKAGDREAARDTLQGATSAASAIADPWARSGPVIQISRAYVAIDDDAAAGGLLKSALAAAPAIKERGKRLQALVWICDAQTEMGAVAAARSTAASMGDLGADTDGAGQMTVVRNADGVVLRTERDASKSLGQHDGAVSRIVEAQVKAGNLPLALEIAKEMRDGYWRANRLAKLAQARAEVADREGARTIIAAAMDAIDQIESDKWRAVAATDIAEAQAMVGDVTAAIATTSAITDQDYLDEALFSIGVGVSKSGDPATAQRIADPYARAFVLSALARRGDRHARLQAVSAALSAAEIIGDGKLRARVLHWISEAQVQAGDVEGVRRTLDEVLGLVDVPDVAQRRQVMSLAIAEAQANARDFTGALATAAGMSDSDLRAHALLEIAAALYR